MTTKTPPAPDADDELDDDTGNDDTGGDDETNDDAGAGDEATIEKVVRRILSEVLGSDDDGGDGDGGGDMGAPRTGADEERRMESVVRRAMGELRDQETTATRLQKMEKVVERVVKETAPAKLRLIERAMWGDRKK